MPDAVALKNRRRTPGQDAILIVSSLCREASLEGVGRGLDGEDRHGVRAQVKVQRLADAERLPLLGEVEMGHLPGRMHAGIGAARGLCGDGFAGDGEDRIL